MWQRYLCFIPKLPRDRVVPLYQLIEQTWRRSTVRYVLTLSLFKS